MVDSPFVRVIQRLGDRAQQLLRRGLVDPAAFLLRQVGVEGHALDVLHREHRHVAQALAPVAGGDAVVAQLRERVRLLDELPQGGLVVAVVAAKDLQDDLAVRLHDGLGVRGKEHHPHSAFAQFLLDLVVAEHHGAGLELDERRLLRLLRRRFEIFEILALYHGQPFRRGVGGELPVQQLAQLLGRDVLARLRDVGQQPVREGIRVPVHLDRHLDSSAALPAECQPEGPRRDVEHLGLAFREPHAGALHRVAAAAEAHNARPAHHRVGDLAALVHVDGVVFVIAQDALEVAFVLGHPLDDGLVVNWRPLLPKEAKQSHFFLPFLLKSFRTKPAYCSVR